REDIGARIELHRIEHLLGRDITGRSGDELSADVRGDTNRAHHAEVDDDRRERWNVRGIAVFGRIESLAALERKTQPQVRRLDVAMNEAGAMKGSQSGARLHHDTAKLEERHQSRHRVLAEIG